MMKVSLSIFLYLSLNCSSVAQFYQAGETYFGDKDYIEYQAGNLPVIISAPHGGSLEPTEIPDRNCSNCVYVRDANTEELIRQIGEVILEQWGCYPHIIINRLHHGKLDANRAIGDAADDNTIAERAWTEFQGFIELAKDSVEANYGRGLYIDLHGHGHEIQRLELGYRINKSELQLSDATLNEATYTEDASMDNNLKVLPLLRGQNSLGELYEIHNYPAVPSQTDPYPEDEDAYFRGGYNTERHGSKLNGTIDAIQIECNRSCVRDSNRHREAFAKATAEVLKKYLKPHCFGTGFLSQNCALISSLKEKVETTSVPILLYPNPVQEVLNIDLSSFSNT